jgi:hypothetical protein
VIFRNLPHNGTIPQNVRPSKHLIKTFLRLRMTNVVRKFCDQKNELGADMRNGAQKKIGLIIRVAKIGLLGGGAGRG